VRRSSPPQHTDAWDMGRGYNMVFSGHSLNKVTFPAIRAARAAANPRGTRPHHHPPPACRFTSRLPAILPFSPLPSRGAAFSPAFSRGAQHRHHPPQLSTHLANIRSTLSMKALHAYAR